MHVPHALILLGWLLVPLVGSSQADTLLLAQDEHFILGDAGEDPSPDLNAYGAFVLDLGGDSIRSCGQFPCTGWVEDRYPNGRLKHRGFYDSGRLTVYKNYHPNGAIEREYKAIDEVKSVMRSWHSNGMPRSETRFADGASYLYEDHYLNGQLRYAEERDRNEPFFVRMELYAASGEPISLLKLMDRSRREFDQQEFHPGGKLKCTGHSRYNAAHMDCQRIGMWTYFNPTGKKVREEDYIDGKVHAERNF